MMCDFYDFIDKILNIFSSLYKSNGLETLISTFLGACFAYLFNLKQQKKKEKSDKEEKRKQTENENFSKLTYLYVYMDIILSCAINTLNFSKKQIEKYDKFLSSKATHASGEILASALNSFRGIKFNYNDFFFTAKETSFLVQLATVNYYIQTLFEKIEYFNKNIEINFHKVPVVTNVNLVNSCKKNMLYIQNSVYYLLLAIDKMKAEILNFNQTYLMRPLIENPGNEEIKKILQEAYDFYKLNEVTQ